MPALCVKEVVPKEEFVYISLKYNSNKNFKEVKSKLMQSSNLLKKQDNTAPPQNNLCTQYTLWVFHDYGTDDVYFINCAPMNYVEDIFPSSGFLTM
jgi:hypothetical protein